MSVELLKVNTVRLVRSVNVETLAKPTTQLVFRNDILINLFEMFWRVAINVIISIKVIQIIKIRDHFKMLFYPAFLSLLWLF